MTRLITFADPEAAAVRAAAEIAQLLRRAREERGVAHLALSGGGTPERAYELLAAEMQAAEWKSVEVWFADERCVGPEHEQSNYRMAHEKLLGRVPLAPARVHRMEGELGPQLGAERYAQALRDIVAIGEQGPPEPLGGGTPPPGAQALPAVRGGTPTPGERALPALDVIVLGIGPDGHVASLFPGAPTLSAGTVLCLGVSDSPKPPPQRITLSLAMLRAARRCLLLATGPGKAAAIAGALREPSAQVPASLLRRERLTVIVDDAASPPAPAHADAEL